MHQRYALRFLTFSDLLLELLLCCFSPGPALGVGRVGSRLGPQDLGGAQMPKIGPQLVAIKRSRYPNRTVTTLIEQPVIQSNLVEH